MSTDTLALLLSFLIISLFGFGGLAALIILVSRDTTKTPEVVNRVSNIEKIVERLAADVGAERSMPAAEIWRTADGKYEAGSFEELLTKMAQDPNTPLSVDEIESIKSIFEKIMGESDDDEPTGWKDTA
jgi:hypothetical protein